MDYDERATLRSRHVSIAFSLPLPLVEVFDRYVDSLGIDPTNRVNSSKVAADLFRDGLRAAAVRAQALTARAQDDLDVPVELR